MYEASYIAFVVRTKRCVILALETTRLSRAGLLHQATQTGRLAITPPTPTTFGEICKATSTSGRFSQAGKPTTSACCLGNAGEPATCLW